MRKYNTIIKVFLIVLLGWVANSTLIAQDLGSSAHSKLTWKDIASASNTSSGISGTIGLTTDKKMYVWGSNYLFTIHTNSVPGSAPIQYPIQQTAPFYLPNPAGESIKKVGIQLSPYSGSEGTLTAPIYFCLSESGKLYSWGINNGLVETAWPVASGTFTNTLADTVLTKRRPIQLTILGETSFLDFSTSGYNYWVAIGASGKAYHIGVNGSTTVNTFAALPNPTGVNSATFKYTNVWCSDASASTISIYLKGNDGKIYYTGRFSSNYASGVASIFPRNTPTPTLTSDESAGNVRTIVPLEVPFPAGENIIKISVHGATASVNQQTNYALSASGKVYAAGLWRMYGSAAGGIGTSTYVVAPLKAAPSASIEDIYFTGSDTLHTLKTFTEMAMPPGATGIIDVLGVRPELSVGTLVVSNNNKVFFSGSVGLISNSTGSQIFGGNFVSAINYPGFQQDRCVTMASTTTKSYYSWEVESVNYEGAAKLVGRIYSHPQLGIISKTGRGYFAGQLAVSTGTGKTAVAAQTTFFYSVYPVPIANEQLLSCQTSAGPGGTWDPITPPPNTGVGTIDCSKTQIAPAPVAGIPSQTTLIVTVNVTTAGTFSPITVSGSGMSLGNGITSVSTTTTGIKTFYIPIQYDGSALTNSFQFTVGSAGSCTADLTKTPVKAITDVWTLECLPSVGPSLKK